MAYSGTILGDKKKRWLDEKDGLKKNLSPSPKRERLFLSFFFHFFFAAPVCLFVYLSVPRARRGGGGGVFFFFFFPPFWGGGGGGGGLLYFCFIDIYIGFWNHDWLEGGREALFSKKLLFLTYLFQSNVDGVNNQKMKSKVTGNQLECVVWMIYVFLFFSFLFPHLSCKVPVYNYLPTYFVQPQIYHLLLLLLKKTFFFFAQPPDVFNFF